MKTQAGNSLPFLLSSIASISLILLGIAGVARIMGWLPDPSGGFGKIFAIKVLSSASAKAVAEPMDMDLPQAPGNAREKRRCPECGVIVSMRETDASGPNSAPGEAGPKAASEENGIGGTSARRYEFTVRMIGGARRVIVDANPTSWRPGERVIVIADTSPSRQ